MNKLVSEIRDALKPHRVDGFQALCFPMPTLQQVEQLVKEVEKLTGALERIVARQYALQVRGLRDHVTYDIAKEALE